MKNIGQPKWIEKASLPLKAFSNQVTKAAQTVQGRRILKIEWLEAIALLHITRQTLMEMVFFLWILAMHLIWASCLESFCRSVNYLWTICDLFVFVNSCNFIVCCPLLSIVVLFRCQDALANVFGAQRGAETERPGNVADSYAQLFSAGWRQTMPSSWPRTHVFIGGNRVHKESRVCLRSTKNGAFLLGHVTPKRNTPLLGHLGTVLRLDGTYVWTER